MIRRLLDSIDVVIRPIRVFVHDLINWGLDPTTDGARDRIIKRNELAKPTRRTR